MQKNPKLYLKIQLPAVRLTAVNALIRRRNLQRGQLSHLLVAMPASASTRW